MSVQEARIQALHKTKHDVGTTSVQPAGVGERVVLRSSPGARRIRRDKVQQCDFFKASTQGEANAESSFYCFELQTHGLLDSSPAPHEKDVALSSRLMPVSARLRDCPICKFARQLLHVLRSSIWLRCICWLAQVSPDVNQARLNTTHG